MRGLFEVAETFVEDSGQVEMGAGKVRIEVEK
jgi:hypothetical protein